VTLYLNFRSQTVGGSVIAPRVMEGDGTADPPMLRIITDDALAARAAGKDLLFATHGFNVNYENGARSLGRLDTALALAASELFVAVLWPGDWWLPAVNYPFAGGPAQQCGQKLASYCNDKLGGAHSFAFVSHSLGARVILEAVENLSRPARIVCLTAGAVNDDCLTGEYSNAAANGQATSTLASRKDTVLQLAYPVGDLIADALHGDHPFGEPALGRSGPAQPTAPTVRPSQIPDAAGYNHGDYLPPSDPQPLTPGKWSNVASYILRTFRAERPTWP
jgi:hypothetical protein